MQQKAVCHPGELREDLLVFNQHWPAGEVGAGHHKREINLAEEEVVEPGVGEHEAHRVEARGHRGCQPFPPLGEHHDGPPG